MNTQEDDVGQSSKQTAATRPALDTAANNQRRPRFDSPIRNLKPQRGFEVITFSDQQSLDEKQLGKVVRELKAQLSRINETDKEIEQALQYQYSIPTYLSNIYVHHVNKLMRFTKSHQQLMAEVGQQLKSSIALALKAYQSRKNLLSEASFQTLASPTASKSGKLEKTTKLSKPANTLRKVKSEKLRFSITPVQVEDVTGHPAQQSPGSKQTPLLSEHQSSQPSADSPGYCASDSATVFFPHLEQRKQKFTLRSSLKTQPNTVEFTRLQSHFLNKLEGEQPQIKVKRTVRFVDVEIERPTDGCQKLSSDHQRRFDEVALSTR